VKNHRDVVVKKPWGYEYLVYESTEVALWLLHIESQQSTSLHCHPMKTTGLILLSGTAELGFISDSKIVIAPEKQMIRRGLFHSTKALSSEGVYLFEIETPNDKGDLVRLNDAYGRAHEGYETVSNYLPRPDDAHWISEPLDDRAQHYSNKEAKFVIQILRDIAAINELDDETIVMFLRGGLGKEISGRLHLATVPGDIGKGSVLKRVATEMDFLQENTLILKVG
jgi:mannose-6-phosphate isomerase-like protein (cupin superfamily)